jgi:hypothetical protein
VQARSPWSLINHGESGLASCSRGVSVFVSLVQISSLSSKNIEKSRKELRIPAIPLKDKQIHDDRSDKSTLGEAIFV